MRVRFPARQIIWSPGLAQVQTPVNDTAMHAHTPGGQGYYQAYPPATGKWD